LREEGWERREDGLHGISASPNLTPDQKTKMETAMTEHHKAGCTEATEAKFMKDAQGILTPEQFAKFKAECSKKEKAGA